MIEGAAGLGVRHLARWVGERAHELGAAAHLGSRGGEVVSWHGRALLSEAAPLLARVASFGPAVLRLEGAFRTPDALRAALKLLDAELPLLLVLTATGDEEVPEALLDEPRVLHLPLAALEDEAIAEMLHGLLAVSPGLAAAIVAEATGNPGRALALLRYLIEEGGVIQGPDGLQRRPGAPLVLPTRPDQIRRLAERVRSLSAQERAVLHIVGAGGALDGCVGAIARLLDARLLVAHPDGGLLLADPALAELARPDA